MTHSETSSLQSSDRTARSGAFGFAILSFIGFTDAAYLTISHYLSVLPPCSLIEGCEKVLTSSYATLGPIPVALFGAVYYIAIFFLALFFINNPNERVMRLMSLLAFAGLLATGVLTYLQLFVINAICLFCLISAAASAGLAVLGGRSLLFKRS
jgi:uncharacterized membrane protein